MKKYKAYLIDLDGTMYRGSEPIPEAVRFVNQLRDKGIPHLYMTNNSTSAPETVAERLAGMGVKCVADQVMTTSLATARYLHEQAPSATVYVVGEQGLQEALEGYGFRLTETNPDAVVMGLDRGITYDKLSKATVAVRNGAMFISTNEDAAVPTEQGFHPGNGALTSVVTTAAQKNPVFIGKPQPIMVDMAMQVLGLSKDEVALIGDNYDTDILTGVRAGIDTIHVNTGVTSREAAAGKETPPVYQVETLAEWADYL